MYIRPHPLCCFVLVGCADYPEQLDYGQVCVSAQQVDDKSRVLVEANSRDCASDHRGATFDCSVEVLEFTIDVETRFMDGKDPNDACALPLTATCEAIVDPGTYTLVFGGERRTLEAPSQDTICIPEGRDTT
jgi:hypothetical protein